MPIRSTINTLLLFLIMAGCTSGNDKFKLPGVYRIDIQQGNVIEQEMIDKLKPGMDKNQVRFIMGSPAVLDPFHVDRWDYIYTFSKAGSRRQQLHISLYFEEEKLAYLDGDVISSLRKPPEEFKRQSRTVDVPLKTKKEKSFFGKMVNILPFVGDDDPQPPPEKLENQDETEETEQITHIETNIPVDTDNTSPSANP